MKSKAWRTPNGGAGSAGGHKGAIADEQALSERFQVHFGTPMPVMVY